MGLESGIGGESYATAVRSGNRIPAGSGTSVQEVNQVLKQYLQMRKMVKQYGAMANAGRLKGLGAKLKGGA